MSMRELTRKVDRDTKACVTPGVRQYAAHQAMAAHLDDWTAAYELLGRRISVLRAMHDERKAATEAGDWP